MLMEETYSIIYNLYSTLLFRPLVMRSTSSTTETSPSMDVCMSTLKRMSSAFSMEGSVFMSLANVRMPLYRSSFTRRISPSLSGVLRMAFILQNSVLDRELQERVEWNAERNPIKQRSSNQPSNKLVVPIDHVGNARRRIVTVQ